jgi:hypothetical protein
LFVDGGIKEISQGGMKVRKDRSSKGRKGIIANRIQSILIALIYHRN